jgi:hypothetical protein
VPTSAQTTPSFLGARLYLGVNFVISINTDCSNVARTQSGCKNIQAGNRSGRTHSVSPNAFESRNGGRRRRAAHGV